MENEQFDQAGAIYTQIIQHAPDNLEAKAGLGRCHIEAGNHDEVRELLNKLSDEERADAVFVPILNALELADKVAEVGDLNSLEANVESNSKDYDARYKLALALYANGDAEAATEELLEIIRQDRNWNEDAARIELLKLFEVLGATNPVTISGRRKLSSILFS